MRYTNRHAVCLNHSDCDKSHSVTTFLHIRYFRADGVYLNVLKQIELVNNFIVETFANALIAYAIH